jgi:hypothetical protein
MSEYAIPLSSCPPLSDVVLALCGDQALPETRSVTAHLRHCAVCRESLGEVEGALTVAAAARAREITSLDFSIDGALARKRRFMNRLAEVKQQHAAERVRVQNRRNLIVMAIALIVWLCLPYIDISRKALLQRVGVLVRQTFGLG